MVKIRLTISTPAGLFLDKEVDILNVKTVNGNIGILFGHAPTVSTILISPLMYRIDGKEFICAIAGGILNITPEQITILTEAIESREDIDLKRAQEKRKELENKSNQNNESYEISKNSIKLKKIVNRLRVKDEGFYL